MIGNVSTVARMQRYGNYAVAIRLGACPLSDDGQHHATPFANSRGGSLAGFGVIRAPLWQRAVATLA